MSDKHQKIEYAEGLLQLIAEQNYTSFSGLGLVFYHDLNNLLHCDLGAARSSLPKLPVIGEQKIADALGVISNVNSPWHDGFHFIDSTKECLTYLSQFIVPPSQHIGSINEQDRPFGARHMTALLISHLPGIDCIGILDKNRAITIIQHGQLLKT